MRGLRLVLLLALGALAVAVAGCGGTGRDPSAGRHLGLPPLGTMDVGPYPLTDQYYRYRDMLDHRYLAAPTNGSYDGCYDTLGLVTYSLIGGKTLQGTLTAHGLKQHFAYQIKLEGQPTEPYPWTTSPNSAENWSNKQIGSVGRWWCNDCGWNVTDSELRKHRGHWILGYLLFDFLMTDISGSATQPLYLDSSFHVVWRTDQRPPNRTLDGKPRPHSVTYGSGVYESPSPFPDQTIYVYAEGESQRPRPGRVTLPAGSYRCRLLLTEESFHNVPPDLPYTWGQTYYPDGGFWAHALSDEAFAFTISGGPPHGKG